MPLDEHCEGSRARTSWDDLRVFAIVVESGSLRAAATALKISVNSVRAKVENLELLHDARLLQRSAKGIKLTDTGRAVYGIAVDMKHQFEILERLLDLHGPKGCGTVKVGVTEGVGTFWLTPRAVEFRRDNPHTKLDLRCEMRIQDISKLEVDLAVQLDEPENQDAIITRLGHLHLMMFASIDYVAKHGEPWVPEDMSKFDFVDIRANQILDRGQVSVAKDRPECEKAAQRALTFIRPENVAMQTNNSSAHAFAIAQGLGIGVLPTYARAVSRQVRPVMQDCRLKRDIWLVINPESKKLERVQNVIDWLKASFDATQYPWFRDEFVSPTEIDRYLAGKNVERLFPSLYDIQTA